MNVSNTTQSTTISIRGLSHDFGGPTILDNLDLDVSPGEFLVLLGRSGTGKSTLLRLLAGLETPQAGVFEVPDKIGVAFQEPRLLPWKRAKDNVAYGLTQCQKPARQKVADALADVELSSHADAWPLTLSGGQAQRVSLARALVTAPTMLLLDEPFGALDALTRLTMQDVVLKLWCAHKMTIVMVTHDISEVVRLADRVVVLDHGHIVTDLQITADRPRRTEDPQLAAVTRQLARSLGLEY